MQALPAEMGKAHPRAWSDGSAQNYARCLLDAEIACSLAGIPIQSVRDLSSSSAVSAIAKHYKTPDGLGRTPAVSCAVCGRSFECLAQTCRRICAGQFETSPRTPRRNEGETLPRAAHCMDAAAAAFIVSAVTMISGSKPRRGRTLMRDAVLLAVELSTSLRRSEFQAITLDVMFFKAEAQVTIVIPEFASKVRRVQLGLVRYLV